jgi:hypothetical protein
MGYLKRMVREQSHVVIAAVHQPRSAIWLMFDSVTLLASGRLMYHGPREGITSWFGSLGYGYDASLHGVPSDWWASAGWAPLFRPTLLCVFGSNVLGPSQLLCILNSEFLTCRRGDATPPFGLPPRCPAASRTPPNSKLQ